MKNLLTILFLYFIFSSCTKSKDNPQTIFRFRANETLYQCKNPYTINNQPDIRKTTEYGETHYYLECYPIEDSTGASKDNTFEVYIVTDNLTEGTYNGTLYSDAGGAIIGNAVINRIVIPETNCLFLTSVAQISITITRLSNGTADGTFSGSDIRTGGGCGNRTITYSDGEFKNIKVLN